MSLAKNVRRRKRTYAIKVSMDVNTLWMCSLITALQTAGFSWLTSMV